MIDCLDQLITGTPGSHGQSANVQPAIWGGVPRRNPNFTGRDDLLVRLRDRLASASGLPHALVGPGGVGKTQLATEYAYRHRDDYDLIWWIAAEDPVEVRRSPAPVVPSPRRPRGR